MSLSALVQRDGYFTSSDILAQVTLAINIATPTMIISSFDSAPTQLKWADTAISARKMPLDTSKPGWSSRDSLISKAPSASSGDSPMDLKEEADEEGSDGP